MRIFHKRFFLCVCVCELMVRGSVAAVSVASTPYSVRQIKPPHAVERFATPPQHSLFPRLERRERAEHLLWDYWSWGFGLGLYTPLGNQTDMFIPIPDFRVSVERSWYMTSSVSCVLDISVMTPTVRIGFNVDKRTRIVVGLGCWVSANLLSLNAIKKTLKKRDVGFKNEFPLTPSIGVDHYIGKSSFFRAICSLDCLKIEGKIMVLPTVMLSLQMMF